MKLRKWEIEALEKALTYDPAVRWSCCPFCAQTDDEHRHNFKYKRHCEQFCAVLFPKIIELKADLPCPAECGNRSYADSTITRRVRKELKAQ